ncbi:MAG: PrsW family glutamic-type intramembrane protease [Promethearchaeota archaeon]
MTQYLSPLLFLGIWIPFAGSFLNLDLEVQSLKRTGPSILFASVLVVLGALLLNQRLLFVILNAISSLFVLETTLTSQFVVNELIVGIILPANEEIMKILPIIVVARASIIFFNPEKSDPSSEYKTHHSIMTLRQFGFYGIVSGTIFTFLELFLYQWQLVDSTEATEEIFVQILFRTLAPVHILTTFLITLGIGLFLIRVAENTSYRTSILTSTGYFIAGWALHSLWNTINIFYGVFRQDAESELYMILTIFGIFIFIMLFTGIIRIFKPLPRICSHCGLEEKGYHLHDKHIIKTSTYHKILLPLFSYMSINKLKKSISCPFCANPLILGTCSSCGASTFVTCPQCNGFISETTSVCPHCNKKINPVIELQTKAFSWPETFILGISSLASLAFLIAPISILVFGQMGELGSLVNPILLFYFLISLTTLINVITTLFFNRTAGMLVLFCYFLSLALLIFIIVGGFVIISFMKGLITQDTLGLGLICLGAAILFFIIYRFIHIFIFNYSPVFPEYEIANIGGSNNSSKEVNDNAS